MTDIDRHSQQEATIDLVAGEDISRQQERRPPTTRRRIVGAQPLIGLVVLIVVFAVLRPDTFPTASNLVTILAQGAILAVVAGGLTIVIVLGDFDLSIASTLTLGGVVAAATIGEVPTGVSVVLALAAGAAVGIVNGIVVAYVRVNSFIGTLGVGAIVTGIVLAISQGSVLPITDTAFLAIGQSTPFGIPSTAIIAVGLLAVLWVFLNKTEPGRRMDAVGGNIEASRLAGIRVPRYRLIGFVISGVCAAGAGALLASQLGGAYANSGGAFLLQAFTACFLGAVTLRVNEFHVVGTAVGVLIMAVAFNGLTQLGVEAYWQSIAQGTILVLAVGAAALSGRWGGSRRLGLLRRKSHR